MIIIYLNHIKKNLLVIIYLRYLVLVVDRYLQEKSTLKNVELAKRPRLWLSLLSLQLSNFALKISMS